LARLPAAAIGSSTVGPASVGRGGEDDLVDVAVPYLEACVTGFSKPSPPSQTNDERFGEH
jgi:hypothetical protein